MIKTFLNLIWLVTPDMLSKMLAIAQRDNDAVLKMLETKSGTPLENSYKVTNRDGVAIIPIKGVIMRHANILTQVCGATSLEFLARDFNAALEDKTIKAIVFDIDSPGGDAAGINEFSELIYNARTIKPIKAYVESTCASAAYFIASACDEIIADEMSLLGSIGVVTSFEREGENAPITIVSSQSPNKHLSADSNEGRAKIQAVLDDMADVFISKVARNRGMRTSSVIDGGDAGGVLVAKKAIKAGLADRLGSLEGLVSEIQGGSSNPLMKINSGGKAMSLPTQEQLNVEAKITQAVNEALLNERLRVSAILEMRVDGADSLILKAIEDGTDVNATASEVLKFVKTNKTEAKQTTGAQAQGEPSPLYVPPVSADILQDKIAQEKAVNELSAAINKSAGVK